MTVRRLVGAAAVVLILSSASFAQHLKPADTKATPTQVRQSQEVQSDIQSAKDWGVTAEEWTRYRRLMQSPLSLQAPNIDPLTALGIEARSDAERRRYAELQVQYEFRRAEKLFAYQRAYDAAWKRLYPTVNPVRTRAAISAATHKQPWLLTQPRLALFTEENCPHCDAQVRELQRFGKSFDLYLVGSGKDDARLRRWAAQAGVDPAQVRSRVITLNHDEGRWRRVGDNGKLPALMREVNGRWQRE
jgi:integrating conjugative element protein (TIGR03759 family)